MSRDAFHEIAARIHDPLLLLTAEGRVLAANPAARDALGDGLVGAALDPRVAEPERFRRYLALASRSTSPTPGAMRSTDPGGRWRCDASLVRPARGGEPAMILLHLRTTTAASARFLVLNAQIERLHAEVRRREALEVERTRLLEGAQRARAVAEEANRSKDEFLAAVSHELRTPLQAIAGWVSLLQEKPGDAGLVTRGLAIIDRNVQAQTQLVEDLLDLSRMTAGGLRLQLQPVDVQELVRQAVDSARPAAQAKQQRIELVSDSVPCFVNGDAQRLQQVFWNLMSNATKYTPKHGKIQVVVRQVNSHVEIRVSDTGEGIADDLMPYIFDRFRRGDAARTRRTGGLGLGLSIARQLVELHGGMIMAHSDGPGRGATFTVSLPLPLFGASEAPAVAPAAGADPEGRLAGLRVLLVEDHEDSRELLASILDAHGASVIAAECSAEAQRAFADQQPHAIVSDIEMPGEDGFTLIRKLRVLERERGWQRAPAIAITAHTIGDARLYALRAGFQSFLAKPFKSAELVELLASLCDTDA